MPHNIQADETTRILFLGDSLTAGYDIDQDKAYPQLIKELAAGEGTKLDVINGGMSGDTSAGGLRRLPWFLKGKIDICMIALGANDGLRGLPVGALKENLIKIIDAVREAYPDVKIILSGMKMPANFGEKYRQEYEAVFQDVSKIKDAEFIPFLLDGVSGVEGMTLPDRLHPSEEGQKVMAGKIWPVIRRML